MVAVQHLDVALVKLLVNAGADPRRIDNQGHNVKWWLKWNSVGEKRSLKRRFKNRKKIRAIKRLLKKNM